MAYKNEFDEGGVMVGTGSLLNHAESPSLCQVWRRHLTSRLASLGVMILLSVVSMTACNDPNLEEANQSLRQDVERLETEARQCRSELDDLQASLRELVFEGESQSESPSAAVLRETSEERASRLEERAEGVAVVLILIAQGGMALFLIASVVKPALDGDLWETTARSVALLVGLLGYFTLRLQEVSVVAVLFAPRIAANALYYFTLVVCLPGLLGATATWLFMTRWNNDEDVVFRFTIVVGVLFLCALFDLFLAVYVGKRSSFEMMPNLCFILGSGLYVICRPKP